MTADTVALITGATSGIGLAAASVLASPKRTLILACRNPANAASTAQRIAQQRNAKVTTLTLDLADQHSVRSAATMIQAQGTKLDLVINNAGMMSSRPLMDSNGIELTFATNHLGPYLFTRLLAEHELIAPGARVVNVASQVHYSAPADFERVFDLTRYSGMRAYARSKLANVMFSLALARRLSDRDVHVHAVHPGIVATNILPRNGPWLRRAGRLASPLMKTPLQGAASMLHAALDPQFGQSTGTYLNGRSQITRPSRVALDESHQERLWSFSAELTGLNA